MPQTEIDWSQVACTACGNCCPDGCRHKEGNLCAAHPSIVGKERALRLRGKCGFGPLEIFAGNIYCPPVVHIIEERLGLAVEPLSLPDGRVTIVNFEEVASKSRELRGLE